MVSWSIVNKFGFSSHYQQNKSDELYYISYELENNYQYFGVLELTKKIMPKNWEI